MAKTTKTTASEAYAERLTSIRAKLAKMQQLADAEFGGRPATIHWGHAGNLAHIDEKLEEILGFLGQKA